MGPAPTTLTSAGGTSRPPATARSRSYVFIGGSEDELTASWIIRATTTTTAAAVGGSEIVEIPGAGHSAYAGQATAFDEAVLCFCG